AKHIDTAARTNITKQTNKTRVWKERTIVRIMSRVTIQSIADHLGISKFAVSRALTGKSGVSETTRLLVQNAADELGYQNRRRTPVVGKTVEVIFKDRTVASRELWIDVQSGVDSEAVSNGYNMAVRWTDNPNILKRLEANT